MSSEIVLADPFIEPNSTIDPTTDHAIATSSPLPSGYHDVDDDTPEPFDSERLPPTLVREIQRFLRVANSIQIQEPRVAYLCKPFH